MNDDFDVAADLAEHEGFLTLADALRRPALTGWSVGVHEQLGLPKAHTRRTYQDAWLFEPWCKSYTREKPAVWGNLAIFNWEVDAWDRGTR